VTIVPERRISSSSRSREEHEDHEGLFTHILRARRDFVKNASLRASPLTEMTATIRDLSAAGWPRTRPPHLPETCLPGVFAVGDVRGATSSAWRRP
jgi:hypothetical protein